MTDQPYSLNITTSDGKYTVQQLVEGRAIVLRYGEPWAAYEGKMLSNLELALAFDLEESREKLDSQRIEFMAAIKFATSAECEDAFTFLDCWREGRADVDSEWADWQQFRAGYLTEIRATRTSS
ncbi:hypothetical protein [Oricola sp.]|uniref:hypothetical protein n=1 Tax=Oricola sp. TaxID=1979950 RepID=UPI0025EC74ED|nr:hypothetical protein [Oricola sp.]MCI5073424.1 hypothetical protein [Oricola sp.]